MINRDNKVFANKKDKRLYYVNTAKEHLGETRMMNCGEIAYIVEYNNNKDITVQFKNTGEFVNTEYNTFKKGNIKSHFTPSVYGVGITGFENIRDEEGKQLKSYNTWKNMLQRCYSKKWHEKYPTYVGCSVCKEWLYYSNFKKWFEENYYEVEGQRMDLDKDILYKGNKVYSPDTCVFVPQNINKLFTKSNANRGDCLIGCYYNKRDNRYQSQISLYDPETNRMIRKALGLYEDMNSAFMAYKVAKEENIKNTADYYKDIIPERLYEAMINYEVEIDD